MHKVTLWGTRCIVQYFFRNRLEASHTHTIYIFVRIKQTKLVRNDLGRVIEIFAEK